MHATSLQGFGYDDVVHQFEKHCKKQGEIDSPSMTVRAFLLHRTPICEIYSLWVLRSLHREMSLCGVPISNIPTLVY
ncbi:MAG: hypothetical protein MGU50_02935 [Trichodesmium sp. MAG_R02]|nr:hypothetical protein [Trichodesmium sp. MAG_R02]